MRSNKRELRRKLQRLFDELPQSTHNDPQFDDLNAEDAIDEIMFTGIEIAVVAASLLDGEKPRFSEFRRVVEAPFLEGTAIRSRNGERHELGAHSVLLWHARLLEDLRATCLELLR